MGKPVVAVIDEIAAGHHDGFLLGMDGNVRGGCFVPSSSSRSEPSLYPVSPAKDTGVNGSRSSKSGTAFDSRSEAWVAPLDRMNPPRSTMTFSWYCNLDALPALVVLQRASVQPLVCREPLISRIRRCCEPYRPNRATCEHNATL